MRARLFLYCLVVLGGLFNLTLSAVAQSEVPRRSDDSIIATISTVEELLEAIQEVPDKLKRSDSEPQTTVVSTETVEKWVPKIAEFVQQNLQQAVAQKSSPRD